MWQSSVIIEKHRQFCNCFLFNPFIVLNLAILLLIVVYTVIRSNSVILPNKFCDLTTVWWAWYWPHMMGSRLFIYCIEPLAGSKWDSPKYCLPFVFLSILFSGTGGVVGLTYKSTSATEALTCVEINYTHLNTSFRTHFA